MYQQRFKKFLNRNSYQIGENIIKIRMTCQRSLMLDHLRQTKEHPTAGLVYEEMKRSLPNISMATVYRNINFFKEHGFVRELNISGISRFDGNIEDHNHFLCRTCTKVIDLDDFGIAEFFDTIEQGNGLKVESANVNFVGICKDCK